MTPAFVMRFRICWRKTRSRCWKRADEIAEEICVKRTCDEPDENEELVEDKVDSKSSLLVGLKRRHIITEAFTCQRKKKICLFLLRNAFVEFNNSRKFFFVMQRRLATTKSSLGKED